MSALPVNANILTYASEVDDLPVQVRSSSDSDIVAPAAPPEIHLGLCRLANWGEPSFARFAHAI
jgi:hypothetical protein